jgi:hypothetical protein
MPRTKQSKTVNLEKGLFLVRYDEASDQAHPPHIRILVNPKYRESIDLVLNPDHREAVLWQPGACLVARASEPGQLFVEVIATEELGSTAATVKIDGLSQGEAQSVAVSTRVGRDAPSRKPRREMHEGLNLVGHVAGIGDVAVGPHEWIGGPSSPARIEGVSIEWPGKPDDLDIRYAVTLARPHTASGRMLMLGDYAGTRGRAIPIVDLSLELGGARASDFQFITEALFLGAPVQRVTGRKVKVAGPTGREPLVGLRLQLEEVEEVDVPLRPVPVAVTKSKSSGRVRVFRSQSRRTARAHSIAG